MVGQEVALRTVGDSGRTTTFTWRARTVGNLSSNRLSNGPNGAVAITEVLVQRLASALVQISHAKVEEIAKGRFRSIQTRNTFTFATTPRSTPRFLGRSSPAGGTRPRLIEVPTSVLPSTRSGSAERVPTSGVSSSAKDPPMGNTGMSSSPVPDESISVRR